MKPATALAVLAFAASIAHAQPNPFPAEDDNPFPIEDGGGSGGNNGGNPSPVDGGDANPFPVDGAGDSSGKPDPSKGNKESYQCPGDNGLKYTTGGVTFELKCGHGTSAQALGTEPCPTLKGCADLCAANPKCQSADWSPSQCNLKAEYIPTFPAPYMTWFPVAPRGCPYPRLTALPEKPQIILKSEEITCPVDDGKAFETPTGDHYAVQCCTKAPGSTVSSTAATDIKDCVNKCAEDASCKSASYTSSTTGSDAAGTCTFVSAGGFQTTQDANHHYLYFIDPPVIDSPDAPTILCSTECPDAHGQQYNSKYGEAFRIECGKRHGTKVIYKDTQPTLQDCVDSCAQLVPCHSVDWHRKSNTCYYGQHHGPALIQAPGWQSAHSQGCAGACDGQSCGCKSQSTSKSEL